MTIDIRPIESNEFEAFANAGATGFGSNVADHLDDSRQILDMRRTLAAFDGEEIVATAGAFDLQLTVPGAVVPTAGVTWVSVKPTHRRQGILTRMMRRQLEDVRDKGEPLAALWASESIIYGRFGYGVSALGADFEIKRPWAQIGHGSRGEGRLRLVSHEEALAAWPAVYESVASGQPGMFTRSEVWWKHKALRHEEPSPKGPGKFLVQYEEEGRPLAYAVYTVESRWRDNLPDGSLHVDELIALTDGAYTSLVEYIFGVDLVSVFRFFRRRPGEPLMWMLSDPRRLKQAIYDALWLRVVDVPAALGARTYGTDGAITIEVRDSFCPWNEGRYRLEAGADGARCRKTDAGPDLVMSAADLAAAYLGGVNFRTLSRAGRVEGDSDALRRADALFAPDVAPWCPEVF